MAGASCGAAACPAEQAWEAHRRLSSIFLEVMFHDVPRQVAMNRLEKIAKQHGKEFADAIRADLRALQQKAHGPIQGAEERPKRKPAGDQEQAA